MAIRILPTGAVEADSAAELAEALSMWQEIGPVLQNGIAQNKGTVQSFSQAFPAMWALWGENVRLALTWMYKHSSGIQDSALKKMLGYSRHGNQQLAGTLQAIGKVAKRFGFKYTDVVIKSNDRRAGREVIRYELTAQARASMARVKQPDLTKK